MSASHKTFTYDVEIEIGDGRRFGRRTVPAASLATAHEQVRFLADRQDKLPRDDIEHAVREVPAFTPGEIGNRISAINMLSGNGPECVQQLFGIDLFQSFGQKIRAELLLNKQISAEEDVRLRVYANERSPSDADEAFVVKRMQLPTLPGQLSDFLAQAETSGSLNSADHPVILLDDVLERAAELTFRRSAEERGVWLIGNLYRQSEPEAEIFSVIHTAIEAQGAQLDKYSIDFSTETFTDIDAQLAKRRKRFGRVGELKLGLYHTHPFLPSVIDGHEACPKCSLRKSCQLTSSFFSERDAKFHRAVFGHAAYVVELVLGLTPREERDLRMFCLAGGTFRQRGYFQVPELPSLPTKKLEVIHDH